MPYKANDRTLPMDAPFVLNNEQFPANWLRLATAEDKAKRGIEWEQPVELKFKDERFYRNWVEDGAVRSEPRDLGELQRRMLADARRNAHALLSGSDWMLIRDVEMGVEWEGEQHGNWMRWRALVRGECNRQEQQIGEAKDVDALAAIVANWPMNPDEVAERERREREAVNS